MGEGCIEYGKGKMRKKKVTTDRENIDKKIKRRRSKKKTWFAKLWDLGVFAKCLHFISKKMSRKKIKIFWKIFFIVYYTGKWDDLKQVRVIYSARTSCLLGLSPLRVRVPEWVLRAPMSLASVATVLHDIHGWFTKLKANISDWAESNRSWRYCQGLGSNKSYWHTCRKRRLNFTFDQWLYLQ